MYEWMNKWMYGWMNKWITLLIVDELMNAWMS